MSTGYSFNGDYELVKLELETQEPFGEVLDLRNVFVDVSLYESIFRKTMSGNISLVDTSDIVTRYALGNGETIRIEFQTSGTSKPIQYEGFVYKTSPPTRISEKSSGIVLHFVSHEQINSERSILQSAFEQENSKTVEYIHNSLLRHTKEIEVTQTRNIEHYVWPSVKPFDAISTMCRRSISATNLSGYLYFEDTGKFNFKPLQQLYEQAPVTSYKYKNSGMFEDVNKKEEESFNSIQDYEIVNFPDLLQQIDDGLYGSTWLEFSIGDKKIVEHGYDVVSNFNESVSLGQYPAILPSVVASKRDDRRDLYVSDYNSPHSKTRISGLIELFKTERFAASISVFGNSMIKVGQVCQCSIPLWSATANDPKKAIPDMVSGKFLMAEIKHTLKPKQYTQSIKIIKDSFEVGY